MQRLAVAGGGARFSTKPPLEPTGTITVFFTICAFIRPEHLGAEVLRAVRPAQAAARDRAAAQVHASKRGEYTQISNIGRGSGRPGTRFGSSLNERYGLRRRK